MISAAGQTGWHQLGKGKWTDLGDMEAEHARSVPQVVVFVRLHSLAQCDQLKQMLVICYVVAFNMPLSFLVCNCAHGVNPGDSLCLTVTSNLC